MTSRLFYARSRSLNFKSLSRRKWNKKDFSFLLFFCLFNSCVNWMALLSRLIAKINWFRCFSVFCWFFIYFSVFVLWMDIGHTHTSVCVSMIISSIRTNRIGLHAHRSLDESLFFVLIYQPKLTSDKRARRRTGNIWFHLNIELSFSNKSISITLSPCLYLSVFRFSSQSGHFVVDRIFNSSPFSDPSCVEFFRLQNSCEWR